MRKPMTIRAKITIANIIILIICSIILSTVSKLSATKLIGSMPLQNSVVIESEKIPLQNKIIMPAQATTMAQTKYINSINFYMILVILLGGIATYIIMKKLLGSLENLEKQIDNITIDNLSEKIHVKNCEDEILRITNKFNNMTDKLNNSFEVQKRFSQNAAHELRTPLTVIRTRLDVFRKKKNRSEGEYEALINSMKENTERLSNIVESLLNLTNFNEIDISTSVDIDVVINKVLEDLYPYAKEKEINIIHQTSNIQIKGNEPLLYRYFYNLIENAIMYNENKGYVKITCKSINKEVAITIEDSGIGIPDKLKKDIFEPFFRVDKSRSRKLGGSGLGLSIVKEIIQKHNGEIKVFDNNPKGTIFKTTIKNQ